MQSTAAFVSHTSDGKNCSMKNIVATNCLSLAVAGSPGLAMGDIKARGVRFGFLLHVFAPGILGMDIALGVPRPRPLRWTRYFHRCSSCEMAVSASSWGWWPIVYCLLSIMVRFKMHKGNRAIPRQSTCTRTCPLGFTAILLGTISHPVKTYRYVRTYQFSFLFDETTNCCKLSVLSFTTALTSSRAFSM